MSGWLIHAKFWHPDIESINAKNFSISSSAPLYKTLGWNAVLQNGFGDLNGEFWFGNEFIHQLTKNKGDKGMRLRVELESHYGQSAWAEYDTFRLIDADRVPELLL